MPHYTLVLYPRDAEYCFTDKTSAFHVLAQIGLLSKPVPGKSHASYAGPRFLELITFLGCSPHVVFAPEQDTDAFTYVEIPDAFDAPRLISGQNIKTPKCPSCKQAHQSWQGWKDAPCTQQQCEHCGAELSVTAVNWRQSACCARQVIIIHEVFEGEAVPGDELLRALRDLSGIVWDYCYVAN
jgi:hypothetical protein